MNLTNHVFKTIKAHRWIERGETVLVGVSGGPDSVALLNVLCELRYQLGINLQVVHFNHRIRLSSDKDEAFVQKLCKKLNVPCHVKRQHKTAKVREVSEDLARQQRYGFFQEIASKTKTFKIILAHNQNDLAETVLMRIIRGTGLLGLRGIVSGNQVGKLRLIRPFLSVSRKEIESYLKQHQIKFCSDETNLQQKYLRNKIRLKLLPLLMKEYNDQLPSVLLDLSETSKVDYEYLLIQAQKLFEKNAVVIKKEIRFKLSFYVKQHASMRRMLLRLAYERLVSNLNQLSLFHIQEVEDLISNRPVQSDVHWPQGVSVFKNKTYLELRRLH